MKKWNDPKIASAVLICCILFGAFFGGYRSLNNLRNTAQRQYFQGKLGDGLGIQNDLDTLLEKTTNMLTLAQKDSGASAAASTLAAAQEDLRIAQGPSAQYAAVQRLSQAVDILYSQMDATVLSPDVSSRWIGLKTSFNSALSTLSHSPYNESAAQFNQTLSTFPASLFGRVTGVKELELFR